MQDDYEANAVLVGVGFQSVQLIAQDYLGTIPEDTLHDCVRMTTAYAAQKVRAAALSPWWTFSA